MDRAIFVVLLSHDLRSRRPLHTGSILAIGGSNPTVVAQKNGFLGLVKKMTVTITCDHRHIYGADAAEFLKDLGTSRFTSPHVTGADACMNE